ncbi:D-alanyl-D-alanine dipeptidase [Xenorhabdus eapokensis]|uniref:D-alanyl-D-alanine dipeptidase n=1 Tax=Xenorhabdus eapokensis TaxID=1873482 RepID=A0A1Q5TWD6_9GAMM|nr:D-alanyl-D-alanine dipeptidase [Xenorhabdus eapokensis]
MLLSTSSGNINVGKNAAEKISIESDFDWKVINEIPIYECHESLEMITDSEKLKQKPVYYLVGQWRENSGAVHIPIWLKIRLI